MARPAPSVRRFCSLAAASGAALALSLAAAAPAGAATTSSAAGAASGSAVRLTINLPAGSPLGTRIQLDIDPVGGTVRAVPGSGPEAQAVATVLSGTIAGQSQSLGTAQAKLPNPLTAQGSPLDALNSGIASSPLADFLALQAATSSAAVTPTPTSTSAAGTTLGLGLPTPVADGLKQVFTPLIAGLNDVLSQLSPTDPAVQQVCQGLTAVTNPAAGAASQIPVLGPIVGDVTKGLTDPQVGTLCTIRTTLTDIVNKLGVSLNALGGPGGLLSLGLLQTSQDITTGGKVTSTATSQVGNLKVLGTTPFGTAQVLRSRSTASAAGTAGSATAAVDEAAVTVNATPLALFTYDLTALRGQIAGVPLNGVDALLGQIQTLLDALAGVGIEGGRLGAPSDVLGACPTELGATLSGTFKAPDGGCAAAAARGYGLALTLPAQLATPLGITGPLVQLTFAPSAAVARSVVTPAPAAALPEVAQKPLAHTGLEVPLSAAGLALLVAAGIVRRRRSAPTG